MTATPHDDATRELVVEQVRRALSAHVERNGGIEAASRDWATAWRSLAELGLGAIGAQSGGVRDLCTLMETSGRTGAPVPLLEAFILNRLLAGLPDSRDVLAALDAGRCVPAFAFGTSEAAPYADRHSDRCPGIVSDSGPDAGSGPGSDPSAVSGSGFDSDPNRAGRRFPLVEYADAATHIAFLSGDGTRLSLADLRGPGAVIEPQAGFARPALCDVNIGRGTVRTFESGPSEAPATIARLALTARALGAAGRAFDLALEHAKTRHQFGQPIGRFQAIQHKLADAHTRLDGMRLALETAAIAIDSVSPDRGFFAEATIAAAGPALRQTMLDVQHVLGAVGFSESHESPHHFRRVHADVLRLGGTARARHALSTEVLDRARTLHGPTVLPLHDLGPGAAALRAQVRAFMAEQPHRGEHADVSPTHGWDRAFSQALAARGWLGLTWPKAFGGAERSVLEQFALLHELDLAGAPTSMHIAAEMTVGPAIMAFGSPEQKARFLPPILRGELTICLGYSEPEAGSDLASLRTKAVRDGDHWVIHGQKLWTTGLEHSQYIWLAARTDPEARAPHLGISMFMVPMDTPGITLSPSMAFYGQPFTASFWDGVRVPRDALIGEVNGGWKAITHALAGERLLMGAHIARLEALFASVCRAVARDTGLAGRADVRARIGELAADVEIARQLVFRTARLMDRGAAPMAEAAMCKVVSGELMERLSEAALDLLGERAMLEPGAHDVPCRGGIQQMLRTSIMMVVGGGTAEIQRNLIAQRALGLPR